MSCTITVNGKQVHIDRPCTKCGFNYELNCKECMVHQLERKYAEKEKERT